MKQPELMSDTDKLSFPEEVGNAISHGAMMFVLLFLLPYYSIEGYVHHGWAGGWGIGIYLLCMILMFGTSCLYHIMPYGTLYKSVFRRLDHMMILLAIAGTYTPICLVVLHDTLGYVILTVEWVLVLAGILLKSISKRRLKVLSLTIYLVMGWLAILVLPRLLQSASPIFLGLIVAGGVLYTVGIWFYNHPERNFFHFTWHVFIVLASLCHLAAILYFLP